MKLPYLATVYYKKRILDSGSKATLDEEKRLFTCSECGGTYDGNLAETYIEPDAEKFIYDHKHN